MQACDIRALLSQFSQEVSDLTGTTVAELDSLPPPDQFRASYVSRNRPCVIRGAAKAWPAVQKWSLQHIVQVAGDHAVTCTFTPDGLADSVKDVSSSNSAELPHLAFVLPHTETLPLRQFADLFHRTRAQGLRCVPSVQFQNSNLTELAQSQLYDDIAFDHRWLQQVFGAAAPDASNIWIGDCRSVTSFHKDHYENWYVVIAGTKSFTLKPPTSIHEMELARVPVWQEHFDLSRPHLPCTVQPCADTRSVEWSTAVPGRKSSNSGCGSAAHTSSAQKESAQMRQRAGAELPQPIEVTIGPGDALYLPAMWQHHVTQDEGIADAVVAVNTWWDMEFDDRYATVQLLTKLARSAGLVARHSAVTPDNCAS